MFVSGYILLLLAVAVLDRVKGEDDEFTQCVIQSACVEPNGQVRAYGCIDKMGKNDKDYVNEYFTKYFSQNMTLHKVIETGCKDTQKGKKAFNEYYDARKVHETENKFSQEDNQKMLQTRECVLKMVMQCVAKKQMGFSPF